MMPDVRTMWMLLAATALLFGFLEVWAGSGRRRDTPIVVWGCANLAGGVGSGLLSTEGVLPYALSEATANGLQCLCWALIWAGVRAFGGESVSWWAVFSGPALVAIACLYLPPFPDDTVARINLTSAVIVVYMVLIAVDALRAERHERLGARRMLAVLTVASVIPVVLRSVEARMKGAEFMANSAGTALPLMILFTLAISINICFLLVGRERLGNQLARAAVVDGLTGVLNRSGFLSAAQQAVIDGAPRFAISVVLMDLDEFKAVNDRHGHAAGDALIAGFAAVARDQLRSQDVLGRIGGEEFCALLLGASESEAVVIADRLRVAYAGAGFAHAGGELAGTVSVGVAQLHPDEELSAAIQRADRAMYQAKKDGRDRVVRASD